jgi:hypothetical protein
MENQPAGGSMRAPKERFGFVHEFLNRVFIDDLHAKRVLSLANGTLGGDDRAALAVFLIGQALAQACGLSRQVHDQTGRPTAVPYQSLIKMWLAQKVG